MTEVEQARSLFGSGDFQKGLDVLARAARRNDAAALEALANMSLSGQLVRRDLKLARDLFRRAASAGSASAASAYRAFLANGTGGAAEWTEAVHLLDRAAAHDPRAAHERALIAAMQLSDSGEPLGPLYPERVSEAPEATIFRSLLTAAECDFLIEAAGPLLQPSVVVEPETGRLVPNAVRTSDAAAFPWVIEGPAIHALCRRLARASNTDVRQGEPLQILRYSPGQEYRPHFDALSQTDNQRILTFLVYLNDDFEGGETRFEATAFAVKGRKGDGLLFRNADRQGRTDPRSQHCGLPVTKGEKFIASRWIRQMPLSAG